MKKSTISLLIAVVLLVIITVAYSQSSQGNNTSYRTSYSGRFQLFGGDYVTINEEQKINQSAVFKIDTITGRTWIYNAGLSNGQSFEKWKLIPE